jgi:cytochrome c-type biogenesis protein
VAVAFLAGLLSFLSPCVLPVVPSYLSYVTGMSGVAEMKTRRHLALLHAMLFVVGFSLIFIAVGMTATAFGRLLNYYQVWIARIGGALLVLLGLWMLGAWRSGLLSREFRFELGDKPLGYLGSVLTGVVFGAGWTPCIGPILASIVVYISASPEADLARGIPLMIAYSAGLAVPFLAAAFAVERFLLWSQAFRKYVVWVERTAAVLIIVFGLMLLTGTFTLLAQWLQGMTPAFLRERL